MTKAISLIIIHVLLFVGLMSLFQYWSCWGVLADHYHFRGKPNAKQRWFFLTAWMGAQEGDSLLGVEKPLLPLRSCLNVAVNEAGMHLSIFPLFRLFHPPLFIPWEHIATKSSTGVLKQSIDFSFLEAPGVVLRLKKPVGNNIAAHAPGPPPSSSRHQTASSQPN